METTLTVTEIIKDKINSMQYTPSRSSLGAVTIKSVRRF